MDRVKWDGEPLEGVRPVVPSNLHETVFDYLPPPVPTSPAIHDLGRKYRKGEIDGRYYAAMQAAAFVLPQTLDAHRIRQEAFRKRAAEAAANGFVVPDVFRRLVTTDAYVDRLHHNCIWLQMPEELWPLPSDTSKLVFLAFVEGQGCCNWHLLLNNDGTHSMICCDHPFGMTSIWMGGVPDFSNWVVHQCADSIEEWLYHYFLESAEHARNYVKHLDAYQRDKAGR